MQNPFLSICFFASGDTVSIIPTFRQFCACLSDGNGASFGMIARYGVSFRCRYTSYIASSLVEAAPGVHPAWARPQFLQRSDKRRKTRLADAVILSTVSSATKRPRRVGRSAIDATLGLAIYFSSRESGT